MLRLASAHTYRFNRDAGVGGLMEQSGRVHVAFHRRFQWLAWTLQKRTWSLTYGRQLIGRKCMSLSMWVDGDKRVMEQATTMLATRKTGNCFCGPRMLEEVERGSARIRPWRLGCSRLAKTQLPSTSVRVSPSNFTFNMSTPISNTSNICHCVLGLARSVACNPTSSLTDSCLRLLTDLSRTTSNVLI